MTGINITTQPHTNHTIVATHRNNWKGCFWEHKAFPIQSTEPLSTKMQSSSMQFFALHEFSRWWSALLTCGLRQFILDLAGYSLGQPIWTVAFTHTAPLGDFRVTAHAWKGQKSSALIVCEAFSLKAWFKSQSDLCNSNNAVTDLVHLAHTWPLDPDQ